MWLRVCPSSRVRRSRNELHKQRLNGKTTTFRTEDEGQKLGRYPSMIVEDALVSEYEAEQSVTASRLASVRSRYTMQAKHLTNAATKVLTCL